MDKLKNINWNDPNLDVRMTKFLGRPAYKHANDAYRKAYEAAKKNPGKGHKQQWDINPNLKINSYGSLISDEYDDPNNLMGI